MIVTKTETGLSAHAPVPSQTPLITDQYEPVGMYACVRASLRACVRASVHACVRVY